MAPGNGALVAAVVAATGRHPLVAGKPGVPLMAESVERVGSRSPLVVGDRLDTDIEAGHASGIPSLLVLTGVTDVETLLAAPPRRRPTYLAVDLRGLLAPPAALALALDGLETPSADDGLAALRGGCRRAWSARDEGRPDPTTTDELARWSDDVAAALAR